MTLYSKAVANIAGQCVTQIAAIDRHRDSIDRIDNLATTLCAAGISATANVTRTGTLSISIEGDSKAATAAIERTGHRVISEGGQAMILPPESPDNALPAILILID